MNIALLTVEDLKWLFPSVVIGGVIGWIASRCIRKAMSWLFWRYSDRRERRRWKKVRLWLVYQEPWSLVYSEVTVQIKRPVNGQALTDLCRKLQRRRQSAKPPKILGALELED